VIAKLYRLRETEVKKVLRKGKPFFSYGLVLNALPNGLEYNRFAIVISGKSVNGSVERNYFRRLFYSTVVDFLETKKGQDCVFVVKAKTKLERDEKKVSESLKKDILFLLSKIDTKK